MNFIDTSYLVAMAVRGDGLHRLAMQWTSALRGPFLTSEFLLLEFINSLSSPSLRGRAHRFIDGVRSNASVEVEPVTAELLRAGVELHKSRPDKSWSLTDCTSFIIMTRRGVSDALTHDQHFEQAGFRALLRREPG
jgi:predicted nucleic acid-binding protein